MSELNLYSEEPINEPNNPDETRFFVSNLKAVGRVAISELFMASLSALNKAKELVK